MLFPNGTELRSLCSRLFHGARRLAIEAYMATRPLLPTLSTMECRSSCQGRPGRGVAQASYYTSLFQPGALPVSGLDGGNKGFSTICHGVGRPRIGTRETTRRTRCTGRLEWLRVSSHSYRVIPKYTRLTALI
jgi:hypothetical protein